MQACTPVIASVTASVSWSYVRECFRDARPTKPAVAITLLLCLFMGTVSIYQIFLSTLLICQEIRRIIHLSYHLLQLARRQRKYYLVVSIQEAFDRQLIHP
ncbi:hypothetical protein EVAR_46188_1 [Eumeta japonica]|uniref:Uncharacterized protein n=1 Tax=Eumeta variegata TaxID=151549 RepID=A0A4C1WE61_EUMVA|nr:hypothetical protein EVAR_46188_1 [Eumeta japonica]